MILVGLGANLPHPQHGPPAATLSAALRHFSAERLNVVACSRFFESAPVPASDQPWFVNAVARIETGLDPASVLAALHRIEATFGRIRHQRWEARVLDLDLLDYAGAFHIGVPPDLQLPHPRLAARGFVLLPLADLAPDWVHPVSGKTLAQMIAALDRGQIVRPCAEAPPIP
ncbi:MAG: 2-amino-4-hydroxy-6-hydroxymethyldihydropteridine diphosphokinase [Alphaproteobacteria bacterium]|nr:2-amino-4-hydroxy-6-hydroxymethyldihydropteridine diphosphokinase [Alphaproteobacteria bacterium]